jgi:hypothetical protein
VDAPPVDRLPSQNVPTVDGDKFQVVGEDRLYDCPIDAIRRAKQVGAGTTVIRLSDGKSIASIPGYEPPAPKEWK